MPGEMLATYEPDPDTAARVATTVSTPTSENADASSSDRRAFLLVAAIVALIGLRVLVLVASMPANGSRGVPAFRSDAHRYHQIAEHPGVPYRDFEVEYPPVSLALIELVNGDDLSSTMRQLAVAAFALDMVALAAVWYGWGRKAAFGYLVLTTPFLYLPFIYFRVDYLAVALALWGMALARNRREVAGGVLLALAVFAKLWPLVVLPVLLVERRTRAVVATVVTGAVGAIAWFAVGSTSGFEQVLTFRGARGWQIESVVGGAVRMFSGEYPHNESGAVRVGTAPRWATTLLALLMVAIVAWIWSRVARAPGSGVLVYGIAPITAVAAFLVCAPLLSPQYMTWLVPFAAICWASRERTFAWITGWMVILTMVLSQIYEPLYDARLSAQTVLALRNALLIALLVVGLAKIHAMTRRPVTS